MDRLEGAVCSGDTHAAVDLGLRLVMARGVPADPPRGIAMIEQAARGGHAQGAWLAATIASATFWRERDWDAAFDFLARAAGQGHVPAQSSLRILAGGPGGGEIAGRDWPAMRDAIDLAAWLAPPVPRLVRESPRIQTIEKFAPPAACDWLMAQAKGRLSRATIYDRVSGGTAEDERRTNSQCDLDIENCGVLTFVLRGRIAAVTGGQDAAMEVPKVLHYEPGQTFARHFDYLNPEEPAYAREIAERGQRTDTVLVYLNDDFSGGETRFPLIDFSYSGAQGDALLFRNVDATGAPDGNTMHTGLPPTTGEKWVFSQWIREYPQG